MPEIGEILKKARLAKGLTLEQVGKAVGVGKSTVLKWESGAISNMRRDKIAELANVLGLSPTIFITGNDDIPEEYDSEDLPKGVKIPVLGYVRAGYPIYAEENIIDYEEISERMAARGEFFGLVIRGDSMEPRMFENDVIIVRRQPTIENGEIAVVLVNGDEATVKKVLLNPAGMTLVPLNSNCSYIPRFYSAEEIENLPVSIIGKVVEVRGKI